MATQGNTKQQQVILTFGGNLNNNYRVWLESCVDILVVTHKRVATVLKTGKKFVPPPINKDSFLPDLDDTDMVLDASDLKSLYIDQVKQRNREITRRGTFLHSALGDCL
jgi:hypothetical protein